jgi:uncharacterized membrane protein
VLWCVAVLLVLIGVIAALGRALFMADLATRAEPIRERFFEALRVVDPFAAERPAELQRFDSQYADHPRATLVHVVCGGVLLALVLVQFSPRVRGRHIAWHRWSGRLMILLAFGVGLSGLYFGVLIPFSGSSEALAIALFGVLFLAAITRAFVAIRTRRVALHRKWMIRAFALAIAISTVRIVMTVLDPLLTLAGFRPPQVLVLSMWTGWIITVAAAEVWIRFTRSRAIAPTA